MNPRIETLKPKKLIGLRATMSLTNNLTGQLWGGFGPRIKEITNRVTEDKISLQVYPNDYYQNFNPSNEFEKWVCIEVSDFNSIPERLDRFDLAGGRYAVFDYKGPSSDPSIFQYIFSEWIPNSNYEVDDRPHFEVLGEKYINNSPDSEEEIWIPIRRAK